MRKLLAPEWIGVEVRVALADQVATAKTDRDGDFTVDLRSAPTAPFHAGLHPVTASVPGALARTFARVVSPEAPFVVVSDIDDTVMVSNVLRTRKLIGNALLKDAEDLAPVPGMAAFYRCLMAEKREVPGLAFVSGTPVQYLPRVATFLRLHQFPPAGVYLRNLGPNTLSGYKQPVLKRLLAALGNPVVLVGDSGEKDPEIYAWLRQVAPERVRRIYIRNAGRAEDKRRFEGMVLFDHAREAAADAVAQGFMTQRCLEEAFPAGPLDGSAAPGN